MSTKSHKANLKRIYQSAKDEAHRLQMPGMAESIVIDRIDAYIQKQIREANQKPDQKLL